MFEPAKNGVTYGQTKKVLLMNKFQLRIGPQSPAANPRAGKSIEKSMASKQGTQDINSA